MQKLMLMMKNQKKTKTNLRMKLCQGWKLVAQGQKLKNPKKTTKLDPTYSEKSQRQGGQG